ncbi:MAG: homoserine dehydrogenase [Pseudomonadota bacterium]
MTEKDEGALSEPTNVPPLRLAVAGLGTVGGGLLNLLASRADALEQTLGRRLEVAGVCARDRPKDRGIDLSKTSWFDDPVALAKSDDIDVFVELIGGSDGVAKAAVEAALAAGRDVVTANKALLARHGTALAELAEANGAAIGFEAAVAGGIPAIKTLREALTGNAVTRVYGILNGTCNFILTKMEQEGRPFAEVLAEAQALGYAEADPTFDVGGHDTAHKLALLTSLAFGTRVSFDDIELEGITTITPADIQAADELGYRIKLLGVAQRTDRGIEQRVHPAMVRKHSAIAEVSGVTNAVAINGDQVGDLLLVGPGAGAGPTASAVAGDIVDIARGWRLPPFLIPADKLSAIKPAPVGSHRGGYYIRLNVQDRPGVMAAIANGMADHDVSLESIVQRRPADTPAGAMSADRTGPTTSVVLITHETDEASVSGAVSAIEGAGDSVVETPQIIRIEQL